MSEQDLMPFLAIFGAVALLVALVWLYVLPVLRRRREHLEHRMNGHTDSSDSVELIHLPAQQPTGVAARFDRGFERWVARTGLDLTPGLALAIILFCGVLVGTIVFIWRFEEEPWVAIPAFFLGALVPIIWLWRRSRYWQRTLEDQFPDTLFLLARSMRAGRTIDQAFQTVAEQGVPPWTQEFNRMHRQLELGLSLSQTVQSEAERLGILDFNIFASVVGLHRTTGGNLPVLLDRLAISTRDRNQFRKQYRSATVLGRYSAGFIAFLVAFILVYLFFFQREWAMRFFETGIGIFLFCTAMLLEICGGLLLLWLLRYDY
jgi:tight adherence protein B